MSYNPRMLSNIGVALFLIVLGLVGLAHYSDEGDIISLVIGVVLIGIAALFNCNNSHS